MTYALVIEYDGTDFHGWQVQTARRTVQGELQRALGALWAEPVRTVGAGRTDRGVHATCQVASFTAPPRFAPRRLVRALGGLLPEDVVVRAAVERPVGFHARYDALARQYTYTLATERSAINRRCTWQVRGPLDPEPMTAAAGLLPGRRDCRALAAGRTEGNPLVVIDCADWAVRGTAFTFTIKADRFLSRMVRTLVGAMVAMGRGAMSVEAFARAIGAGDRRALGQTAPPQGLCLSAVEYPGWCPAEERAFLTPARIEEAAGI